MDTSRSLSTRVGNFLLVAVLLCGLSGTAVVGLIGLNAPMHADEPVAEPVTEVINEVDEDASDETLESSAATAEEKKIQAAVAAAEKTLAKNGTISYAGKVVDTDGKPVAGADLHLVYHIPNPVAPLSPTWKPLAQSDANGDFEFEYSLKGRGLVSEAKYASLIATKEGFGFAHAVSGGFMKGRVLPFTKALKLVKDRPIKVRVVDIDGQPVAGAKMTMVRAFTNTTNDLSAWNKAAKSPMADFYKVRRTVPMILNGPQTLSLVKPATSDKDGRLEIRGVGAGRVVRFLLEGPGIESEQLFIRTEAGEKFDLPRMASQKYLGNQTYYPSEFEHISGPSVPITGIVRDAKTKKPLAGVAIKSQKRHGQMMTGWGEDFVRTFTDADGRYRLEGMPVGNDNRIAAIVPDVVDPQTGKLDDGQVAYFSTSFKAPTTAGEPVANLDFEMQRGVWAKGRITDRKTGKGLPGKIGYHLPKSNPNKAPGSVDERDRLLSNANGYFRIPVATGEGYLSFMANDHQKYPRASGITLPDGGKEAAPQMMETKSTILMPTNHHLVAKFDAGDGSKDVELDLQIGVGMKRTGKVVDENGKSVIGFHYRGKKPVFSQWTGSLFSSRFAIESYEPDQTRHLYFTHLARNLAGHAAVTGDPQEPLVVKLVKGGSVKGRILNEDGDPLANRSLIPWTPSMSGPGAMNKRAATAPLPYSPKIKTNYGWQTDEEGRFEFKCLIPDIEYRIMVLPEQRDDFVRPVDVVIKVASDESKDLGDLGLADGREFERAAMKAVGLNEAAPKKAADNPTITATPATADAGNAKETSVVKTNVALPDGTPANRANVALVGFDREARKVIVFAQGITDAKGYCHLTLKGDLPNIDNELRTLLANKDGYGVAWKNVSPKEFASQTSDPNDAFRMRLSKEHIVKGRLIDIEGQPAVGEKIRVRSVMNPAAKPGDMRQGSVGFWGEMEPLKAWCNPLTTGKDGRFEVRSIPEAHGTYLHLDDSEKFAPQGIALNTGQPEQRGANDGTYRSLVKNVEPGEEALLTLAPAKIFTGTITYEDTGEPVPNTKVSIWASQEKFGSMTSLETRTDEQGKYRLLPKPGIRFGVSAYPPSGVAYMGRRSENVDWENADVERTVDIQLPRVTLVTGRVVEAESGKPVANATLTYEGGNKSMPENAIDGWKATQKTDADGKFAYAVPPGRGTIVVRKRDSNLVLNTMPSRKMVSEKDGGTRFYANAFHTMDVEEGQDLIEVSIPVNVGNDVRGVLVDEKGTPIEQAFIISRCRSWDLAGGWRGDSRPNVGSEFELKGLDPKQTYKVHFLDAKRKLGATVEIKGTDQDVRVVLQPCGQAKARYIVEDEENREKMSRGYGSLQFVLTPGVHRFSKAMRKGALAADEDFNANIDRVNYGRDNRPQLDDNMEMVMPALIPGATYRLPITFDGSQDYKEFTVKSGEMLDLGEFAPKFRLTEG